MRRGFEKSVALMIAAALVPLPMGAQNAAQVQNSVSVRLCDEGERGAGSDQRGGARRKTGEPVRGLKQSDFTIYENGKKQQIATFDFQSVDMATPLNEATVTGLAAEQNRAHSRRSGGQAGGPAQPPADRVLFRPDQYAARGPGPQRGCGQGFPAQEDGAGRPGGAGFARRHAEGGPGLYRRSRPADQRSGHLQRHRRPGLRARAQLPTRTRWKTPPATRRTRATTTTSTPTASCLRCGPSPSRWRKITEKKSLLYFSGGIQRDGIENQASLRAAINAAVRANLAIYSVDTRGLQVILATGDASTGSLRGQGAYNGGALTEQHERQLCHARK